METRPKQQRANIARLLLILAALAVIAVCAALVMTDDVVAIRYLGRGRTAVLRRVDQGDTFEFIKVTIRQGTQVAHEGCLLFWDYPQNSNYLRRVDVFKANGGDVVGIVTTYEDGTQRMETMYEFSTGRAWPCERDAETWKVELFGKLKGENAELQWLWLVGS